MQLRERERESCFALKHQDPSNRSTYLSHSAGFLIWFATNPSPDHTPGNVSAIKVWKEWKMCERERTKLSWLRGACTILCTCPGLIQLPWPVSELGGGRLSVETRVWISFFSFQSLRMQTTSRASWGSSSTKVIETSCIEQLFTSS